MAKGVIAKDLRSKSDDELGELLKSTQSDLFKARFENYTNKLNNTSQVRKLRREIARLNTVVNERRNSAKAAAAAKAKG